MKGNIIYPMVLLSGIPAYAGHRADSKPDDRPNIVIFYMDDMAYGDFSITGAGRQPQDRAGDDDRRHRQE